MDSNYEHKRETVTFFEYHLHRPYALQIDNREVIWADFLSAKEILSRPCSPYLAYYLNQFKKTL